MKLLISTQSTIEYDGQHYYGNSVNAAWKRYNGFGDITIICHVKIVKKASQDKLAENINLVFIKRINSVEAILKRYSKENDEIAKAQVKDNDICLVHLPSDNGYQVIKYCKKFDKPYITVVCGCSWDALWNHGWKGKIMAPLGFYKLRKAQSGAPYSIYVTNEFLQRRYPTPGRSIGCSNVNISTGIDGVLDRRINLIETTIKKDCVLKIGTAAAIDVAYKGQEYVIRALGVLKKEGLRFEYHLIGRGDESRLRRIARECDVEDEVFFHGSLPHEEVLDFLDEMHIYIQPSKQEGLPRSLIEAMSRGCMCLGSNTAGIPELIEPQYVFPKGGYKEMSQILSDLSKDDFLSQARRNFEKAKEYDQIILNNRRASFIHNVIMNYF